MEQFKTVFAFEYFGYIKSKGYIISTILFAILAALLSVVPTVLIMWNREAPEASIAGVVDIQGRVHDLDVLAVQFPSYTIVPAVDTETALANVENGSFAWVLVIDGEDFIVYVPAMTLDNLQLQHSAQRYISELHRRDYLVNLGMDTYAIESFFEITPQGELVALGGGAAGDFLQNYAYAFVMTFILYIAVAMYGQFISTSVVTEKSSKAMELLITSVKPIYLMFGKVLGTAAAALTQMGILMIAGIVSFVINAQFWASGIEISEEEMEFAYQWIATINADDVAVRFIYMGIFFVLGFLLYAFLYAAFASTAQRMEDVNTVQGWPLTLLVVCIMIITFGLGNASSTLITVSSYIPFFTPLVMLVRFIMGAAGHGEVWIGIALLVVSVVVLGYISAKIYRMGVLMYGKPPKPLEVIKMLWSAKVN